MRIFMLVIITFVTFKAAQQDWKLYMHDPGLAEYIVSLAFVAPVFMWIFGLFKKL